METKEQKDEVSVQRTGTSVNLLLAAGLGLAATVLFYVLIPLLLFRTAWDGYMYNLFCQRGWIPYEVMYLAFWGLAILGLKLFKVREQRTAFGLSLLPVEHSEYITSEKAQEIIRRINKLDGRQKSLMLVNRIWRALMRRKTVGAGTKMDDILSEQAALDAESVDSSYTTVKVFIWAVPVLGFIGTVVGISAAIGNFNQVVQHAGDMAKLKEALNDVTRNLAVAFETTLVSLVMSVIMMFAMSALQSQEEGLLADIKDYCIENLLNKVLEQAPGAGDAGMNQAIDKIIAAQEEGMKRLTEKLDKTAT